MNAIPNHNIIKKFEPLTAAIRNFLKLFNENYDAVFGPDFMVNMNNKIIIYQPSFTDEDGETFRTNFVKRFPACNCLSTFTLSILHEIGHLETEQYMNDDSMLRDSNEITDEDYYNLHNELVATDFAGNWAIAHLEIAKQFDLKFTDITNEILINF